MNTKDISYPSQAYHEQQDAVFEAVESKFMFVQEQMNWFVDLIGCVGVDEETQQYRNATPQEFVENLVQFHNRCVENINKGQSVPRYTALLQECRARMKGVLASDDVLQSVRVSCPSVANTGWPSGPHHIRVAISRSSGPSTRV